MRYHLTESGYRAGHVICYSKASSRVSFSNRDEHEGSTGSISRFRARLRRVAPSSTVGNSISVHQHGHGHSPSCRGAAARAAVPSGRRITRRGGRPRGTQSNAADHGTSRRTLRRTHCRSATDATGGGALTGGAGWSLKFVRLLRVEFPGAAVSATGTGLLNPTPVAAAPGRNGRVSRRKGCSAIRFPLS